MKEEYQKSLSERLKSYTHENKNINFAWSQSFNLRTCLAVAQWIEQRFDSAAGCGFEPRQPDHTLEAPGLSHLGLLCFNFSLLEISTTTSKALGVFSGTVHTRCQSYDRNRIDGNNRKTDLHSLT